MREYSAWRELDRFVSRMLTGVKNKDVEWTADVLVSALWILVNENGINKVSAAGDYEFIVATESEADTIANLFEAAGCSDVNVGYYDPVEDEKDGCVDELTGKWYVR